MTYGIQEYKPQQLSLTYNPIQLSTFTPVFYEPKPIDDSMLFKAIDKIDEADEKARLEADKAKTAMAEKRMLIHQDADSLAKFDELTDNYMKALKQNVEANNGSWHRALAASSKLGVDFASDKTINGMIQSNIKLDKRIQELRSRNDLDENSKNMYEEEMHNKFNNGFIYDNNDKTKIIGTDWRPNVTPVADLKQDDILKMAISLSSPKKSTTGGTTNTNSMINNKGEKVNLKEVYDKQDQSKLIKISTSEGGEHTIELLDFDKLKRSLNNYIVAHPEIGDQIYEWKRKEEYRYKKLEEQLNDPNTSAADKITISQNMMRLATKYGVGQAGGSTDDAITMFTSKLEDALKEYAYKNESNIRNKSNDFGVFNQYASEKASAGFKNAAIASLGGIGYGNSSAIAVVKEQIKNSQTIGEVQSIIDIATQTLK